jgi:epoxyqueuosine reductase
VVAGKDARTLAREILEMSQEEFVAAFRRSPMKRAKVRGLRRNAAVVLGNIGTMEDVSLLRQALADSEPLVREHVACTLERIAPTQALDDVRAHSLSEAGLAKLLEHLSASPGDPPSSSK